MSDEDNHEDTWRPPATDPWKGFRGVCAGTLVLEAIVVLLALPVAATVGGGLSWLSGGFIVVLALAMILGAGIQGKSWAMPYNLVLQAAMIAGFLVHPSLGVLGLIFAGVWGYLIYLRRDIIRRSDEGLLPGQRD